MKEKFSGFLLFLAMPLSVVTFVKVEKSFDSEILALMAAVALYVLVALIVGFIFGRKK